MMPAAVKSSVVAHVEVTRVVPHSVGSVMRTLVTMPMLMRAVRTFRQVEASILDCCFLARAHRLN
jgi:hypothetical protein